MPRGLIIAALLAILFFGGWWLRGAIRSATPVAKGPGPNGLELCRDRPNCVCSQDSRDEFRVEALPFVSSPAEAAHRLKTLVLEFPGSTLVRSDEKYLHFEFKSRIFGFRDDVEFWLDPDTRLIHVRSESRLGYSDLGANRRRMEALAARWREP